MSGTYQDFSLSDWHRRYLQQTRWTSEIRRHLLNRAGANVDTKILEVGSGTGAVLGQLESDQYPRLTGIDIDRAALMFTQKNKQTRKLVQANGCHLPFPTGTFNISLCHYLLLWVKKPEQILSEMRRVTHPGGHLIALAEPDHQARIDYPPPLDELGRLQTQVLQKQGADTAIGRKILSLFKKAGLTKVETGILGGQWAAENLDRPEETEWMALTADLSGQLSKEAFAQYFKADQQARKAGQRILFIPTFYAVGLVP